MSSEAEPQRLRLFIAIELPIAWQLRLAELQREQERATPGYFRWVRPELMHLTVVFLGWQPAARLTRVADLLSKAAAEVPRFALSLGSTNTFGPSRAPRVLWVEALQPDGRLQRLRCSLMRELQSAGVAYDEKPLRPHITLGRGRRQRVAAQGIRTGRAVEGVCDTVHEVVLMESQLARSGPVYIVRARAALGSAPDAVV